MSQRKIKRGMKPATPPKEVKLNPRVELERRRQDMKDKDDLKIYKLVHDKVFDLARKEDPVYLIDIAASLGWSRGRLAGAVSRVWEAAMRQTRVAALAERRAEKEAIKKADKEKQS